MSDQLLLLPSSALPCLALPCCPLPLIFPLLSPRPSYNCKAAVRHVQYALGKLAEADRLTGNGASWPDRSEHNIQTSKSHFLMRYCLSTLVPGLFGSSRNLRQIITCRKEPNRAMSAAYPQRRFRAVHDC